MFPVLVIRASVKLSGPRLQEPQSSTAPLRLQKQARHLEHGLHIQEATVPGGAEIKILKRVQVCDEVLPAVRSLICFA